MICLETGLRSVAMYTCVLRTFRMEFPCFLWTKALVPCVSYTQISGTKGMVYIV